MQRRIEAEAEAARDEKRRLGRLGHDGAGERRRGGRAGAGRCAASLQRNVSSAVLAGPGEEPAADTSKQAESQRVMEPRAPSIMRVAQLAEEPLKILSCVVEMQKAAREAREAELLARQTSDVLAGEPSLPSGASLGHAAAPEAESSGPLNIPRAPDSMTISQRASALFSDSRLVGAFEHRKAQAAVDYWLEEADVDLASLFLPVAVELCKVLEELLGPRLEAGIHWVTSVPGRLETPVPAAHLTRATLTFFEALLERHVGDVGLLGDLEGMDEQAVRMMFVVAFTWGVGGAVAEAHREAFSDFVGEILQDCSVPPRGSVFDLRFTMDPAFGPALQVATSNAATHRIPGDLIERRVALGTLLVPTADTQRVEEAALLAMDASAPLLVLGPSGAGKSLVLSKLVYEVTEGAMNRALKARGAAESDVTGAPTGLAAGAGPGHGSFRGPRPGGASPAEGPRAYRWTRLGASLTLSSKTTSAAMQQLVEGSVKRKRNGRWGAPESTRIVVFLDDLHMPEQEAFGAQPPLELLRLLLDKGALIDREHLEWKFVEDVTVLAAAESVAPGGGGGVPPRLLRHFAPLLMPLSDAKVLESIFVAIFGSYLQHFLGLPFKEQNAGPVVRSTVELWEEIRAQLLPTPSKSHYVFTTRDLARVFQGMTMAHPNALTGRNALARLWIHEVSRSLGDRLVDAADVALFRASVHAKARQRFGLQATVQELFEGEPLVFGDFLRFGTPEPERQYVEGEGGLASLTRLLRDYIDDYNSSTSAPLRLVFFRETVEHVTRIARCLACPNGHMLLLGLGGSGKQTLARFAAAVAGFTLFRNDVTRGFSLSEFREDLKRQLVRAGVEGARVCFLLPDSPVLAAEGILEVVHLMLQAGEVPRLFTNEEREKIIQDVRPWALLEGYPDTRPKMWQAFARRSARNLRFVLTRSPLGDRLRQQIRKFPSLVHCTTTDWFNSWPIHALESVSKLYLGGIDLEHPTLDTLHIPTVTSWGAPLDVTCIRSRSVCNPRLEWMPWTERRVLLSNRIPTPNVLRRSIFTATTRRLPCRPAARRLWTAVCRPLRWPLALLAQCCWRR